MTSCVDRPQQLLCVVVDRASPVMELWLVGGRGARQDPVRVEVLGVVAATTAPKACSALERLMRRHGPWLVVDLTGVSAIDAAGQEMLRKVEHLARRRHGGVTFVPDGTGSGPGGSLLPTLAELWGELGPVVSGATVVRRTWVEGPALVVELQGELDSHSTSALRREVGGRLSSWPGPVVLDMSAVPFIDSSAISWLVEVRGAVAGLELRQPTPNVRRTLAVVGLLEGFVPS